MFYLVSLKHMLMLYVVQVLAEELPMIVANLSFPKTMRWDSQVLLMNIFRIVFLFSTHHLEAVAVLLLEASNGPRYTKLST